MNRFVVGLAFHGFPPVIILQRKNHPDWQDNLLNGPGGRVKEGETYIDAMVREFHEETGIMVPREDWDNFCIETSRTQPDNGALPNWQPYQVYYYRTTFKKDIAPIPRKANDKGEPQGWMGVRQVLSDRFEAVQLVGNMQWLIPLALDWRQNTTMVMIWDDIRKKPKW